VRRLALVAALLLAVAVAAGCGSDKKSSAAELAPRGSIVYGEATLKPEGDQKQAIERLVAKFPGTGDPGARIQKLIEDALRESDSGLSFERDVKPWLGDEAAFFATAPARGDADDAKAAVIVQTDDEDAALDAVEKAAKGDVEKASYEGHDYLRSNEGAAGTVDGFLVAGNEDGFKAAVDTAEGDEPLSDFDDYDQALEDVPDDRLAFFYVNAGELLESVSGLGSTALAPLRRAFGEPYVASIDADDDGVEVSATLPESAAAFFGPLLGRGSSDLVGDLPAGSWLGLGQPDLGRTLERYVDLFASAAGGRRVLEQQLRQQTGLDLERDIIGWMGDFSLFVRGDSKSSLNGALVIDTIDEAASRRAIAAIERLLRREGEAGLGRLSAPGGGEGFSLRRDDDLPQPFHVFQRAGHVVIAYGDAAARDALDPSAKLGDMAEFRDAARTLGEGFDVSTYVAIAPIFALIENEGDADVERAKPYLEPLEAIVAGAKQDGDRIESRLRITVP
jgi:Protein of unknown function (DUF3352)